MAGDGASGTRVGGWVSPRTPEQRFAEHLLIAHPHRLEIRGSPRSLSWPDVCANCGAPTLDRLLVRKAFYRRSRRHSYSDIPGYRVVAADVPYCGVCAARHRDAVPQVSFVRRWATFLFNPAHIATIGFAVLLYLVGPSLVAGVLAAPHDTAGWGFLGALVFGLVWTPAIIWWMTRPDRFERQTEITKACDISPDVAVFYERRRHLYTLRNQAFADAFARANAARIWTAGDQRRSSRLWLVFVIAFVAVLVVARAWLWFAEGR